jgi:CHAT domain-containing protein
VVFVLTSDLIAVNRLDATPDSVKERVENYVELIASHSRSRWEAFGRSLRVELVESWRTKLPARIRRLIVVPDGLLHSLPLEALPGQDRRLLLEDYVVAYAPSATVLAELRNVPDPSGAVLVFANPSLPDLRASSAVRFPVTAPPPLPNADTEGRRVAQYGGSGTELLSGSAATAYRVRNQLLSQFGVLHFATHGVLESAPWRSALLLAPDSTHRSDGRLTIPDIYRLRLHGALVVLSACRSARGRILPGEGVQSLAQAFFHAGARSVVASLWDVADVHTSRFMDDFYRRLANGETKERALRGAKLDACRRDPDLPPRFWAAFVLLGDGGGMVPLKKPPFWRRLFH